MAIFTDDEDHETYLAALRMSALRAGLDVHAFCLMKTHDHLLATPQNKKSLERAMRSLGTKYVRYFNKKYQRHGTIFNERPKGLHVSDERYWLTCLRYIEQNPVRAGIVRSPDEYPWSSYAQHGGIGGIDWLTPHHVYENLGHTDADRRSAYRNLCHQTLTETEIVEQRMGTDPGRSQLRPGSVPNPVNSVRARPLSDTDLLAL